MKAASTNERTMIAVVLTPGFVCEQTLAVETQPSGRPNANALAVLALANSYQFDFQVRQRVTTSLSNYILALIPVPDLIALKPFCVHSTLRLSCNHAGYSPLWQEQLGDVWREASREHFSWPVLPGDDQRWVVRAAIDAVVAGAYGLTRDQYQHILSSFSHSGYPAAPKLCLAGFDELNKIGTEAFTRKYDPYWDIPLNDNLPKPSINLPPVSQETDSGEFLLTIQARSNESHKKG
jgi:hypothetical protein